MGSLCAQSLATGDSLFAAKKYTEANEIYEAVYRQSQASPSMLLKMAFIQEGLEEYGRALYYLNQYHALSANKKALEKMSEIADEQGLLGYEFSDIRFFLSLVNAYRPSILGLLYALSVLMTALLYFNRKKERPLVAPAFVQVLTITMLVLVINNFFTKPQGIIDRDQTLLMTGPSAGAQAHDMIEEGHKVSILDTDEAWIKISWGDQEGYIRKNRIRLI